MTAVKLLSFVLLIVALQSACSLQSQQARAVLSLLDGHQDEMPYVWRVKYQNYEADIYPVESSIGIIFANQFGDRVVFDGWAIRDLEGLGIYKLDTQILDEGSRRYFRMSSGRIGAHSCFSWVKSEMKHDFLSQQCGDSIVYFNTIKTNVIGEVEEITQIIDDSYTKIILTKLK